MSELEVMLEAIYMRLITLVVLCLSTVAFGLNVLHVPGYTVGIAVLIMLIFGRWRLYVLEPWLVRYLRRQGVHSATSNAE